MKRLFSIVAAGAAAIASTFGIASANVITVAGSTATITCTASCEAFTFGAPALGAEPNELGILSGSDAWYYDGTPSSESDEATRLNTLAGTSFSMADATRDETPATSFSTLAAYVVLKLGNVGVYLKNTSGGMLNISYVSAPSLGLSHYTEFGDVEVPEVPIPGAIWIMGMGLAGLGAARRKKKA